MNSFCFEISIPIAERFDYNLKMSKDKEPKTEKKKPQIKEKTQEVISYYLKEPYVPFGVCIFLSIFMQAFIPFSPLPAFLTIYTGCAMLLVAFLILLWTLKHMRANGDEWSPMNIESNVFIVYGPYHYSRNPLFISATIVYLALFVFLNNVWGFVFLILLIKLLNKYAISQREDRFRAEHGEIYEDYHNKTSRWL